MNDDNLFNQVEIEPTYQGRKQFVGNFNQEAFMVFLQSISGPDEWPQWSIFVEGDLMKESEQLLRSMSKLQGKSVIMIDQVNKNIHFISKEIWKLNCDKK